MGLSLVLLALVAIQIRQRHFRRQVEQLHAEILALQLHPGSFADITRLQQEWGAYGGYTGPCTEHHCIYKIEFENGWFNRPPSEGPYRSFIPRRWFFRIYPFWGGHAARVLADVRVRDNKVWGADFTLNVATIPGHGRNEGELYQNMVIVAFSSRVSHRGEISVRDFWQGFRTREELNCLGCEYAVVNMTPQTSAADIERFNHIRFDCLTGWQSCKHPVDLAPALWEQALQDEQGSQESEEELWLLPPQNLAREADKIVLVKVLSAAPGQNVSGEEPFRQGHTDIKARILQQTKNSRANRVGDIIHFFANPSTLSTGDQKGKSPIEVGGEYFFFYSYFYYERRGSDQLWSPTKGLWLDHALPKTLESAVAINQGIALDYSAGEPYDYENEPYDEQ